MAKPLKWPHGVVSKAQWRYLYSAGRHDPKLLKVAHQLTERNAALMPGGTKHHKLDFRSLPERRHHPGIRSLSHSVGKGSR